MEKKIIAIINIIILIAIVLGFIFFIFQYFDPEPIITDDDCVDVNNVASLVHDTCYDAYTKNIFMEIKRSYDIYNIKSFTISFFDSSEKSFKITDVPNINQTKFYKIGAEKNPENINLKLDIVKDFSSPICPESRNLFVKYCPPGSQERTVEGKIDTSKETEGTISIGESRAQDSDILSMDLIEKERIWMSKCESSWRCSSWESCVNGIQKRECEDAKECFIPTRVPDFTRFCDGRCEEKWECEWSECSNGFTTPSCRDINKCGTKYNIPEKIKCKTKSSCGPQITCTDWSECTADYNFIDLNKQIEKIDGTKTRTCIDENKCAQTKNEIKRCSLKIDIYTRRVKKCGKSYIGVYNRLTNKQIAKVERGNTMENPYLNIQLSNEESEYCDYCFDGIKNGDEEQTDCGGGCKPCSEKQAIGNYKSPSLWSKINSWIKRVLT